MSNRNIYLFFAAVIYIFGAGVSQAQAPTGLVAAKVQRVVDGDTIHVRLADGAQISGLGRGSNVKVRIAGIDAPESCQAWGKESTKALRAMLPLGDEVQLAPLGVDRYGRLLADIHASVGGEAINVAAAMVATGNAWNWVEKRSNGRYAAEQERARASSLGLWQAEGQQRPGDFRKEHGPCTRN